MPALSYRRLDRIVAVTLEPPRRAGGPERAVVTGPAGETWTARARPGVPLRLGGLARALDRLPTVDYSRETIDRIVLDVPSAFADAPWDAALRKWAGGRMIVRVSAVPPPYAGRPLAFPLRIAEVSLPGVGLRRRLTEPGVVHVIDLVTRSARQVFSVAAVETIEGAASRLEATLRSRGWPTLDALQLDGGPPEHALLDPGPSGPPGSLGWIERLAGLYQVRLVVLPVEQARLADARRLAARLLERGGPAVVIAPAVVDPAPTWAEARWLYAGLVHDLPLEVAVQVVSGAELFAGAGREDALRVSAGVRQVVERTIDRRAGFEAAVLPEPGQLDVGAAGRARLARGADSLAGKWTELDFDREGGGLYPAASEVERLTRALVRPLARRRQKPEGPAAREPRFVNTGLFEAGPDGLPGDAVAADGPPLLAGASYVLSVYVGRLNERLQAAGALELLVEDRLWDEEEGGLWLELGVAGVGCAVAAASVQPFWVPRHGPSEPRQVPIRMGKPGIAMLRYTLYHQANVVQSFRLAAVVAGRRAARVTDAHRRRLAAALSLEPTEVGERTWYSRLEFSTVARLEESGALPERTLALVVNDIAGTPLITVKGKGDLAVSIPTDIDADVKAARQAMNEVSGAQLGDSGDYAFGIPGGDPNETDDKTLGRALGRLAEAGWMLRSRVLTIGFDEDNDQRLREPGGVIQVAHVIREKVVPWAIVYDFPYDPGMRRRKGRPVAHVACTASLPRSDGTLPVGACATDPACPLHPDRLTERDQQGLPTVLRETVACPLGFWGVRHQIELPPRQVLPGRSPLPAVTAIAAPQAARVMLGFNVRLENSETHQQQLEAALAKALRGGKAAYVVTDRNDVLDALDDAALDVAYLYCHAEGGEPEGPMPPRLLFELPHSAGDRSDGRPAQPEASERITPFELPQVSWAHNPLVMLNGCGTTGFSAHGTSQFIAELVDRRQAAAVVGADVPVAEELAAEVGLSVIAAVVDGRTLGEALQLARRRLLAKRNPLGLVYTLYGSVDLRLADP